MACGLLLFRWQPEIEKHDCNTDVRDRAYRNLFLVHAKSECVQNRTGYRHNRQVRGIQTSRYRSLVVWDHQQLPLPEHNVLLQLFLVISDYRQLHGPQNIC